MTVVKEYEWAEIGERIRRWRLNRGLSQRDLANKTGMTQGGVQLIEIGATNPQLESLKKIAAALGRETRLLVCGEAVPGPETEAAKLAVRLQRILSSGNSAGINAVRSALEFAEALLPAKSDLPRVPYQGQATIPGNDGRPITLKGDRRLKRDGGQAKTTKGKEVTSRERQKQ